MRVLIVAAHPDDELLGVGGTAAAHARRGDEVHALILCEGVSVRYGPERAAEIAAEAQRAARILGVSQIKMGRLPEQRLDELCLLQVIQEIEPVLASYEPHVVYTHFGGDMNRDHRIVSEAVLVAARPCSAPFLRELLMFETASSTEWSSPGLLPAFQPNLFVDITSHLDAKIEAFQCYSHEVKPCPHPRSPECLRARAQHWGSFICRQAAEPFLVVRSIR
ncbi:MAG: PIG-L deacetylase family protein [Bryobacteraceae bacterium]